MCIRDRDRTYWTCENEAQMKYLFSYFFLSFLDRAYKTNENEAHMKYHFSYFFLSFLDRTYWTCHTEAQRRALFLISLSVF